jgi:hypothetical protein
MLTGLIVTGVVLLGTSIAALVAYLQAQAALKQWRRPIPGWPMTTAFIAPQDVPPVAIGDALRISCEFLGRNVPHWTPGLVRGVAAGCQVIVSDVEEWQDSAGRTVAGQTALGVIQVGKSMGALCHELAHFVEIRLEGRTDATHASWTAKGISKACEEFASWQRNG